MTFEAVARALEQTGEDPADIARAVRGGSLTGARGNSGVICAQILRGWADAVELGPADVEDLAVAFRRSSDLAYQSVLDPAEGTILTVAAAAAFAAQGAHETVAAQVDAAARAAREALGRTPEQMPLLARAGVLDAGGMGLVVILEALARALGARDGSEPLNMPGPSEPVVGTSGFSCDGASLAFSHEVMYTLRAPDERVPALRRLLGIIGDSVALVGGDGLWRVHVHVNDHERAVALGGAVGEIQEVEVVSFEEQVADAAPGARGLTLAHADTRASLVAVADGEGARRLFERLGATAVPPDVALVQEAIRRADWEWVIVLPNNPEMLASARILTDGSVKIVEVLDCGDTGSGLVAAIAYVGGRSAEENLFDMREALGRARSAGASSDPVGAAEELLRGGGEVLTVLCGCEVDESTRDEVARKLSERFPDVAVEVHDGGQPNPAFLLAVE